jgi:acyl-coenzyme A thioesterase PaaI-like protein
VNDGAPSGETAHFRALERLYASAPINRLFPSRLHIPVPGEARIEFDVAPAYFHAAGATHGTLYFKMMDDAALHSTCCSQSRSRTARSSPRGAG